MRDGLELSKVEKNESEGFCRRIQAFAGEISEKILRASVGRPTPTFCKIGAAQTDVNPPPKIFLRGAAEEAIRFRDPRVVDQW
jgi:hypothetical protein